MQHGLAEQGDPNVYELPRPMMHSKDLDFSFSGLKTAVLTRLRKLEAEEGGITEQQRADLAAATEAAIVDVLAAKAVKALKTIKAGKVFLTRLKKPC